MIRRDKDGLRVNVDLVFLYLVALIMLTVFAIKAIRWAVES